MQSHQNIFAARPEQQPTQPPGTRPHAPHVNHPNGRNYSFKTAELRAHKHRFLAALNLPSVPRTSQTYPQNSARSRCKTADVQTFPASLSARTPMKNRHFRCPLLRSLNGKAIPKTFAVQTCSPPTPGPRPSPLVFAAPQRSFFRSASRSPVVRTTPRPAPHRHCTTPQGYASAAKVLVSRPASCIPVSPFPQPRQTTKT